MTRVTEIVLFHHAQGLTGGVRSLAATLSDAGHIVHTPDSYDGKTFPDLQSGIGYAQEVGFGTVQERAIAAAQALPAEVVYVGISLGVMAAQQLAQTRPGCRGAVLLESCVPPEEFGDRHLFEDSSLPTYDPEATRLVTERMLAFLARV